MTQGKSLSRVLALAAVVVVFAVAAACDPGVQTPSSSPSSAPTVASASASPPSPSPTPTPTPTSSEAALFAEADAVFRAYQKIDFEVNAQGGADALPPGMAQYLMPNFAIATEGRYRDMKAQGRQVRNGDSARIVWTRPGKNAQGSTVAIDACLDTSQLEWRNRDTDWAKGGAGQPLYFFKRDTDGRLKIFNLERGTAGGCP